MNKPSPLAAKAAELKAYYAERPQPMLIGGQMVAAASGQTFDVYDPAVGLPFARSAAGGAEDVDRAVKAARKALESGPWSRMTPAERAKLMWKLAEVIESHAEDIALLETLNNGKPYMVALHGEVAMAAECLRYNAGWATKIGGDTPPVISAPGEWHAYTLREPVGVCGLITAWNFPFAMAVGKIAPALAAGCTVVLKPAEQTPLTAIKLAEMVLEAGFPEGVINIVTGFGKDAGHALVEHPDVDKISFTGSTGTGMHIMAAAARTMKRVTLELGGKSPNIIFPDANLPKAIEHAAMGVFFNTGQVCVARSRLFIHRKVYDQVVEGVKGFASQLKIGSGLDFENVLGPVVSQAQLDRIVGYVRAGREEGAQVAAGGERIGNTGYFVQPTVLTGVNAGMRVVREEIFGPVVAAMPFDDDDLDAVARLANDSVYGLAASVWTGSLSTAHKMAGRIKAGLIEINGAPPMQFSLPFGGYKQSGVGRENGREGVLAYTELKTVVVGL